MHSRILFLAAIVAGAGSVSAQELNVPPLDYRQRTLDNGLQVLSLVDRTSPTVSVHMWYHVGSRDDPEGRSGFAHLFEHLMFKATKHMPDEELDRLTEGVGGMNNASTSADVTNYYEVVPANHLERLLWAEAERLSNLTVDADNFASERAVVQEEYRQGVEAPPYGQLFNAIDAESWRVHPYRRPTIGNIAELDAASLTDVRAFHAAWYRPDNATLIVVGDFDQDALDGWVERYFGWIPRPAEPLVRTRATEPARSASRSVTLHSAAAPLPALALTWLLPPAADADIIPLEVASRLLAGGTSSRLHQALAYRAESVQEIGVWLDARVEQSLLTAWAILASGHEPDAVRAALLKVVRDAATGELPAAELEQVKTRMLTRQLQRLQGPLGKAFALGQAALYQGDVARVNSNVAALQAVTVADVQRVLRRYVLEAPEVTINYLPAAAQEEAAARAEVAP